jgi:uncharacterized protein (DUF305 family)
MNTTTVPTTSSGGASGARNPLRALWSTFGALVMALAMITALSTPAQADAPPADPRTGRYEVRFMTEMIDHHAMAIAMSTMCLDRADHRELEAMCAEVITAQQREIQTMQQWLRDWYGVEYQPQMNQGDMRAMQRLAELDGADFEIAFLRAMVKHHWKAVVRADRCVEAAEHDPLVSMCQDIVTTQLAEIVQMQQWLRDWYGRWTGRPVRAV